jgi:hypothetical protein
MLITTPFTVYHRKYVMSEQNLESGVRVGVMMFNAIFNKNHIVAVRFIGGGNHERDSNSQL